MKHREHAAHQQDLSNHISINQKAANNLYAARITAHI